MTGVQTCALPISSQRRSLETEITQRPCMVALYGMGDAFCAWAERLYQGFFRQTESRSIRLSCAADAVSSFTGTFCTLAILLSGALLAAEGQIAPGTVAAMYGYSAVFHTLLENVGSRCPASPGQSCTAKSPRLSESAQMCPPVSL